MPFYPVPMTMQTLVVLVIGATFGLRLLCHHRPLSARRAGRPAGLRLGVGPAYMAGPTGGYLAGFAAAIALMGWGAARGHDRSLTGAFVLMSAGHLVILALGWAVRHADRPAEGAGCRRAAVPLGHDLQSICAGRRPRPSPCGA